MSFKNAAVDGLARVVGFCKFVDVYSETIRNDKSVTLLALLCNVCPFIKRGSICGNCL